MKLLGDMNISPSVCDLLRLDGIESVHWSQVRRYREGHRCRGMRLDLRQARKPFGVAEDLSALLTWAIPGPPTFRRMDPELLVANTDLGHEHPVMIAAVLQGIERRPVRCGCERRAHRT